MEQPYWKKRWNDQYTPFHLGEPHPLLLEHIHFIKNVNPKKILVPLCGKTRDLLELQKYSLEVIGVEFVKQPVQDFFQENKITFSLSETDKMTCYQSEKISIYQGDFFDLSSEDLGTMDCIYDRAGLVALPINLQELYANHIVSFLSEKGGFLLISGEYDEAQLEGPPFSVSPDRVNQLFGKSCRIQKVFEKETIDQSPTLQERGVTSYKLQVYWIQKIKSKSPKGAKI